jgi:hypothetical protein
VTLRRVYGKRWGAVRPLFLLLAGWVAAGGSVPDSAAAQGAPPHVEYRTFDTPHFRVVYAPGLREVALRAAAHAEEGHRRLRASLFPAPSPRIELLVTDHTDLSNGFATIAPAPRITLWARPPMDGTALSSFDEWMALVTHHELAHIFHLDRTGALGRAARRVFGRAPESWPFFTAGLQPRWAVEGVAVQVESGHTGAGRIHGTALASVVRAQALDGSVEALGQALGTSPVWPGGNRPYVFGSLFFHWLEEEHGADAVRDFFLAAADQWVPFRLDAAAREATGSSLVELWEDWQRHVEADARTRAEARERAGSRGVEASSTGGGRSGDGSRSGVDLLTTGARTVAHPAPGTGGSVAYLRADGRTDTRIVLRDPDGEERTLARWNGVTGGLAWAPDGSLVSTQPEFVDPWRLFSDVHRIRLDGTVERLTQGLRISHLDVDPGSGRFLGVQEGEGTNRLLVLAPDGTLEEVLAAEDPEIHWAHPRWSPDGRRVVAIRWRRGGWSGPVLLDPEGGEGVVLLEDRAVHTAPAWSPSGDRILWASDRDGAMNILSVQVDPAGEAGPVRQVTSTTTGATQPAVDPEGEWVYFALQGREGWDLARIPYEPQGWPDALPPESRFVAAEAAANPRPLPPDPPIVEEDRPWSPGSSLLPRYWLPTLGEAEFVGDARVLPWTVGMRTSGADLVGRHRWRVEARLPVTESGRRPELQARWSWAGLGQPVVSLSGAQSHRPLGAIAVGEAEADTLYPVARDRRLQLDGEVVRRRIRSISLLRLGVAGIREARTLREPGGRESAEFRLVDADRTLAELQGVAALSTIRGHPFSVSAEEGVGLTLQGRKRFHLALPDSLVGVAGRDGGFQDVIGVLRLYRPFESPGFVPGFSRSVLAFRAAAGVAGGPGAGLGHFGVGGGGGGGDGPLGFTFREQVPVFPVRGYPRGAVFGDRAWAASLELRVPAANLHRGRGAVPLHLDRMGLGAFLDAGGAGRPMAEGRVWAERASVGVEGTLTYTAFFQSPARVRAGVALPLVNGDGPGVYIQSGWAF